jgi:hypothetical protein
MPLSSLPAVARLIVSTDGLAAAGRAAAFMFVLTTLASGCSSLPVKDPVAAAPARSFEEVMAEADKARQDGSKIRERETYREAAMAYPTRKEPWARLAESYFEAGDYGNAILAAQEVIQRDATDPMANGMLAVSGLRVSTGAIAVLRQQRNLSADTRGEAESIVKSLRETVLVPRPTASGTNAPAAQAAPQPARRATTARPEDAAGTTAKPAERPRPKEPAPPANPFDRLR